MIINFNQVLKQLDGTPIPRQLDIQQCPNCGFKAGKVEPMGELILKGLATDALNAIFQDEQSMGRPGISGEEKAKRGLLAMRIYANPEKIDLTTEEISTIKMLISKIASPLVYFQALEILDPTEAKKLRGEKD